MRRTLRLAFTYVELIAVIAIVATLTVGAYFYTINYSSFTKTTADKAVLEYLNQALEHYKAYGGMTASHSLGGTNNSTKITNVISALKTGFTINKQRMRFIEPDYQVTATGLTASGSGSSFYFGGAANPLPPTPVIKNFQRIQYAHNYPGTNDSVTCAITPTTGNALIVVASYARNVTTTDATVTDSLGNTYSPVAYADIRDAEFRTAQGVWACYNCIGGSNTVTVNASGAIDMGVTVLEYSGITGLDATAYDLNTESTRKTTLSCPLSTTQSDAIIGFWGNEGPMWASPAISGLALAPGTISPTQIEIDNSHLDAVYEWLGTAGTGIAAGSPTVSCSTNSDYNHILIIGAFK